MLKKTNLAVSCFIVQSVAAVYLFSVSWIGWVMCRMCICIDSLHIMGMQPVWGTKQKKYSLLGIEIYSHVKKNYCSVLQIGCIRTDACKGSVAEGKGVFLGGGFLIRIIIFRFGGQILRWILNPKDPS